MAGSVFPPELVLRAIAALGMEGGAGVIDDIQKLAEAAKESGVVTKTEGNNDVTPVDNTVSKLLEEMGKTISDLSAKVEAQATTITKLLSDLDALNAVSKTNQDNFARVTKSIGEVREILAGSVGAPAPEPEPINAKQEEALAKTAQKVGDAGKKYRVSPSGAVIYPRD